eukprot:1366005-Rhodomonas_salina.11
MTAICHNESADDANGGRRTRSMLGKLLMILSSSYVSIFLTVVPSKIKMPDFTKDCISTTSPTSVPRL